MSKERFTLGIIVFAQFCCTSLWFAGNAVMAELTANFGLDINSTAHLTSAVQFGFISGTLIYALLMISDRFSPSKVFLTSALLAALCNLGSTWDQNTLTTLLFSRFMVGFFLAGIYPVGMKIAADHFDKKLGSSLGLLVGALVVGTAFPHFLKGLSGQVSWLTVLYLTSAIAMLGGFLIYLFVPDGPYRKVSQELNLRAFFKIFSNARFRSSALGYFGHMWELYAFWALIPFLLSSYDKMHPSADLSNPYSAFAIIAIGGVGCFVGGLISQRVGPDRVARLALIISGCCCLLAPLAFQLGAIAFFCFLLIWGIAVITDSPMFSTLVAHSAIPELKGSALTIVNCIGFAITIFSIQLTFYLTTIIDPTFVALILAIGPIAGLIGFGRYKR